MVDIVQMRSIYKFLLGCALCLFGVGVAYADNSLMDENASYIPDIGAFILLVIGMAGLLKARRQQKKVGAEIEV